MAPSSTSKNKAISSQPRIRLRIDNKSSYIDGTANADHTSSSQSSSSSSSKDLMQCTQTLMSAFHNDPCIAYCLRQDEWRAVAYAELFNTVLHVQLGKVGQIYIADTTDHDNITTHPGCVATVLPPEHHNPSFRQLLGLLPVFIRCTSNWWRVIRVLYHMEMTHPQTPHYYFVAVGTEPRCQGQGLGTAVMREVLKRADAEHVGAYLEASTERNMMWYKTLGFVVQKVIKCGSENDAPLMWAMWRDPVVSM